MAYRGFKCATCARFEEYIAGDVFGMDDKVMKNDLALMMEHELNGEYVVCLDVSDPKNFYFGK